MGNTGRFYSAELEDLRVSGLEFYRAVLFIVRLHYYRHRGERLDSGPTARTTIHVDVAHINCKLVH